MATSISCWSMVSFCNSILFPTIEWKKFPISCVFSWGVKILLIVSGKLHGGVRPLMDLNIFQTLSSGVCAFSLLQKSLQYSRLVHRTVLLKKAVAFLSAHKCSTLLCPCNLGLALLFRALADEHFSFHQGAQYFGL